MFKYFPYVTKKLFLEQIYASQNTNNVQYVLRNDYNKIIIMRDIRKNYLLFILK